MKEPDRKARSAVNKAKDRWKLYLASRAVVDAFVLQAHSAPGTPDEVFVWAVRMKSTLGSASYQWSEAKKHMRHTAEFMWAARIALDDQDDVLIVVHGVIRSIGRLEHEEWITWMSRELGASEDEIEHCLEMMKR